MTVRSMPVPEGLAGERIDVALTRLLGVSRSRAALIIDAGAVAINGKAAIKSDRVGENAWLEVDMDAVDDQPATEIVAVEIPGMKVLYDDADVVVVDKPVGVAAHPSPGWTGPTVLGGLAAAGYRISTSGAAERQGIVHRLDVGTSGAMAVAKSEIAYTSLKRQFKERTVEKEYHAVVQGQLDPLRGTVDAPIDRHPTAEYKWAVVSGGRPSVTHYETQEAWPHASLVQVHLETGRTHQIRVHMAAMKHPCVGDITYGADPILSARLGLKRQWLHAVQLGFDHPVTGERIVVRSAYPEDLAFALERLRDQQPSKS
jgi:23S rRNA pseudouridine1911/1915/1917 synthase